MMTNFHAAAILFFGLAAGMQLNAESQGALEQSFAEAGLQDALSLAEQ